MPEAINARSIRRRCTRGWRDTVLAALRSGAADITSLRMSCRWREHYDDGGFSGGTPNRPALKQLIADVEDGVIDVVVVDKIDRLNRALTDVSKLMEIIDRADTEHPAQLRPVRAQRRADPRQGRRLARRAG